ncbi:hypothetical protein RDV64_23245 (plasmid) [Acuticoccus sp. MNP-M23]|uniref:hypothetical protein n=1 Tax=Acuticoccus sp. MNP-M23 TaxID=3072793 RepID=UPI00281681C6|nr:hypothetical protein [Acuticoccus sp. MNP-M23]WMS45251.1 hypothetical protein RDV64_23245 [Acuticoccus sp. MNP-M23]
MPVFSKFPKSCGNAAFYSVSWFVFAKFLHDPKRFLRHGSGEPTAAGFDIGSVGTADTDQAVELLLRETVFRADGLQLCAEGGWRNPPANLSRCVRWRPPWNTERFPTKKGRGLFREQNAGSRDVVPFFVEIALARRTRPALFRDVPDGVFVGSSNMQLGRVLPLLNQVDAVVRYVDQNMGVKILRVPFLFVNSGSNDWNSASFQSLVECSGDIVDVPLALCPAEVARYADGEHPIQRYVLFLRNRIELFNAPHVLNVEVMGPYRASSNN